LIKINKENDVTLLTASVTDFADCLGYCEYKIPLSIQGVRPGPSQSLILGTKAHQEEEKYELEHVELEPVSVEQIEDKQEDIEFASLDKNIISVLENQWRFVKVSKIGRTRWIEITDEGRHAAEFLI